MSKRLYEVTITSDALIGQLHAEVWADCEEEAEQIVYDIVFLCGIVMDLYMSHDVCNIRIVLGFRRRSFFDSFVCGCSMASHHLMRIPQRCVLNTNLCVKCLLTVLLISQRQH